MQGAFNRGPQVYLKDHPRLPSQNVLRDDAEKAPGTVDAHQAVGAPLVRVREACVGAAPRGPLGIENGHAETVLHVGEVLDLHAGAGGGRVDDGGAIPTHGPDLPHGSALHGEVRSVAGLDTADGRVPADRLRPVVLLAVEVAGRGNLLQGEDVEVLWNQFASQRFHLGHQLLPRHLAVADAAEERLRLDLVRPALGLLLPMSVPSDERLENVDLLNARVIGLQHLRQHCNIQVEEALSPQHLLCVHQDEGQVPLLDVFLLVGACQREHRAGGLGRYRVLQVVQYSVPEGAHAIVVSASHQRHHVFQVDVLHRTGVDKSQQ
mmetsp:Transcript_31070/g.89582  ORF Transcript_31070/g.89582 Transcript_31070/m.89582 type:complete len:321 (+) Transcript_31070:216-1178(+)